MLELLFHKELDCNCHLQKKQFGKDIAKMRLMEFSYKQLLRDSQLKEPLSTLDLG